MAEWIKIPAEIKELIVHRSTENTRNALRACSHNNKTLVEETKLNSIEYLHIGVAPYFDKDTLLFVVFRNKKKCSLEEPDERKDFMTFNQLQTRLAQILKSVHCIKKLRIGELKCSTMLKLPTSDIQQKIRVESLNIRTETKEQTANILSQVEPVYLRKLKITSDNGDGTIYDMPQVKSAEKLTIVKGVATIREDQLLKLKARRIVMNPGNCPLQKYVEKCLSRASKTFESFTFHGENAYTNLKSIYPATSEKILLDTEYPYSKLELDFRARSQFYQIDGSARFDYDETTSEVVPIFNQHLRSEFRIVKFFEISYCDQNTCWEIVIKRLRQPVLRQKFNSIEEAQTKVNEIMERTDYIRKLYIHLQSSKKGIDWPENKQCIVFELKACGVNSKKSLQSLLQRVDLTQLQVLILTSRIDDKNFKLFDLPNIYRVPFVFATGFIQDHHLLKTDAQVFWVSDDYSKGYNKCIKADAINKYLKKRCLTQIGKFQFFQLENISENLDEEEIFEGFEILSCSRYGRGKRRIIKWNHRDYVLQVDTGRKDFVARIMPNSGRM